ncbi:MAG TPA: hypothetical protein VFE33_03335 [Thermoanaerobaculia bacterium]|nr:hypothetical protein [Thermoanaerobaculia bacterium]
MVDWSLVPVHAAGTVPDLGHGVRMRPHQRQAGTAPERLRGIEL